MLKDLDGNQVIEVGDVRLVSEKVAADEPLGRERRSTRREMADRFGRDVESDQIEASIHEWQIVPAVAATDVETDARIVRCSAKCVEDARHERQRRLVGVALVTILGVPARRGQTDVALDVGHAHALSSPQLRTRAGVIRNITRFAGIARPPQSRARPGYFAWNRSASAFRSGPSARNSALPTTVTPWISPRSETASATTHTRESRRRLRTFCVPSTLIIVSDPRSCRNHIGIASGAPSAWTVARTTICLPPRNFWMF